MADADIPAPPDHLNASKHFWTAVLEEWELSAPEIEILALACSALDRADSARKAVRRQGAVLEAPPHGSLRVNPSVTIARNEALTAAKLLKELKLAAEDDLPAVHRSPRAPRGSGRVAKAKSARA
jgi:phage terminase small subunit